DGIDAHQHLGGARLRHRLLGVVELLGIAEDPGFHLVGNGKLVAAVATAHRFSPLITPKLRADARQFLSASLAATDNCLSFANRLQPSIVKCKAMPRKCKVCRHGWIGWERWG